MVRVGGLAGILLALTSWTAVIVYGSLVQPGDARVGLQLFQFLYALVAFWSLFAIVAVYYRVRAAGEAWALFATLIGVVAAVGTMAAALYDVASLRLAPVTVAASPVNPLGVMSFLLTGLWFLIANLLLWRIRTPRPLVLLGFIAAADLFAGFIASLSGAGGIVFLASLISGAIGGPIYWVWLGRELLRRAQ